MELLREITATPAKKISSSAQKMRYEAEIAVIKKRFGGLDDMRHSLGLSRRQICKILMVDPSAWTRWTAEKTNENAPAHVYKMISLIMEQAARDPQTLAELKVNSIVEEQSKKAENIEGTLSKTLGHLHEVESALHNMRTELRAEINSQFETLKKSTNETSELAFGWKLLLIVNIVLVLYVLFR